MTAREPLLAVRGLSKTFPGITALDKVDLTVGSGEIVALVGQNGSGKSTLVKLLAGVHRADPGGEVTLAGDEGGGPGSGLHFIHQDLGLVGTLSTIENLGLDRTLGRRALLPSPVREERRRAEALIATFGGDFDVSAPVQTLSAAERAIVAIARALDGWEHDRNVLILDEPTAALHGDEAGKLFVAIRRIAERGAGVVFISHRLDEVMELADRVVALRDGRLIADVRRGEFDHDDLVRLIAGAIADADPDKVARQFGDPVLTARGIAGTTIRRLDLDLRAGEIVGVSGVIGSGREELAQVLFGAAPGSVDHLEVDGVALATLQPHRGIAAGLGFVPADRRTNGAVMQMSARENLTLPRLRPLTGRVTGRLNRGEERREVARWIDAVDVRPAQPERSLELFSGGNQQKIVLAKWLRNRPKVLLLDEPTQGVDVGAKAGIYDLIARTASDGAAVLVCSSDAEELALLCDRVLVMRNGAAVAELSRADINEAALIRAGLGPAADGAAPETTELSPCLS
jgi:ribose transport system ATP-binding protein